MKPVFVVFSLLFLLYFPMNLNAQQYEETVKTRCDYKMVKQDGKFGVWERSNLIIKIIYDEIKFGPIPDCWQNDGHFFVRKKKKWGVANKKGELVVPIEFDSIQGNENQHTIIKLYKSGKAGLYFTALKKQTEIKYASIIFSKKMTDRIFIEKDKKWGLMDTQGNIVVEPQYDDLFEPGEFNFIKAISPSGKGFIDKNGKVIVPLMYEGLGAFTGDYMLAVKYKGLWGFVDTTGKVLIDYQYESTTDMTEAWAEVVYKGEKGRIDKKGSFIRNPSYDYDKTYSETYDYRIVMKSNKYGYIDKHNKLVVPCMYDEAYSTELGVAGVVKDGKMGLISMSNEIRVPLKYKAIYYFYPGSFILENQEGKRALFNRKGEMLTEWLDEISGYDKGYGGYKKGTTSGKIAPSGMLIPYANTLKKQSESSYFLCPDSKRIFSHNENDYVLNLDILNDGNKIVLLTVRTKKEQKKYALELIQLNASTYAREKTSAPVELEMDKKSGFRKFVKVSDGYLLVTYRAAVWYDQNLNIIHKIIFGADADGYMHDFCADVTEVGKGQKKYIILKVRKDGQGIVSGFDLSSKTETNKTYELHNPFLQITNISGKIHEVNDQNILIIHRGTYNRDIYSRYLDYYNGTYHTTLIDYSGLFTGEGIPEDKIILRNTGNEYFSGTIANFYTLCAVWMGQDGYLHFVAGTEEKPFTSYEVAVGIEPNNGNYKKIYRKELVGQFERLANEAGLGLVSSVHVRQMKNGFHITSGIKETYDGMLDLFDQQMNYLGAYCLPDNIINRHESRAYQDQYTMVYWTKFKNFSEQIYQSFKYKNYYSPIVNDDNVNYSLAFCETKNPMKYLVMYNHFVVEMDLQNLKNLSSATDGAQYVSRNNGDSYDDVSSSNTTTNASGGPSNKHDSKSGSTDGDSEKYHGSIYFKFSYSDKNYTKEPGQRMYIHYGTNTSDRVSTTVGSSATVPCRPGKVYVSYTGEKRDMKFIMEIQPEDCGKTFDSSKF
jgi:hypothetical protein